MLGPGLGGATLRERVEAGTNLATVACLSAALASQQGGTGWTRLSFALRSMQGSPWWPVISKALASISFSGIRTNCCLNN